MALKGESDHIQQRTLESKAHKLNIWRVQFERLQKRWKTVVESAVQPIEFNPPSDPPSTEPLSAKNSLIYHHTRMSSRDPRRKISVVNSPKPTQCVHFNMEPKVHLFKEATGGHGIDDALGDANTSYSSKGTTVMVEDECEVERELEPVGEAF